MSTTLAIITVTSLNLILVTVIYLRFRKTKQQVKRMTAEIDAEDIQDIVIDGWLTMDRYGKELNFWEEKPFHYMGKWAHLPMELSPYKLPMELDPGIRYTTSPQKFRLSLTRNKD